jgi:hypothetical protein
VPGRQYDPLLSNVRDGRVLLPCDPAGLPLDVHDRHELPPGLRPDKRWLLVGILHERRSADALRPVTRLSKRRCRPIPSITWVELAFAGDGMAPS